MLKYVIAVVLSLLTCQALADCPAESSTLLERSSTDASVAVYCYTEATSNVLIWTQVTRLCLTAKDSAIAYEMVDNVERLVGICTGTFEVRY
jgi:hypothetical protein